MTDDMPPIPHLISQKTFVSLLVDGDKFPKELHGTPEKEKVIWGVKQLINEYGLCISELFEL